MTFGQVVVGPPGSGKTTYCNAASQLLAALGRKVAIVNLDPANDIPPYTPSVDVAELVSLENVMRELQLGPNGGMLYCMEYLAANLDWLKERLDPLQQSGTYVLFDCPGQVELFTGHAGFRAVLDALSGAWGWRLAAVSLLDAHLAAEPHKYIAALLLALSTMLNLELPQVNVLSKVDLVRSYGRLPFSLEYYARAQELGLLAASLGPGPFSGRYRKLAASLAELVEDFGLLGFTPLTVMDRPALARLLGQVDRANGACYARLDHPPAGVPAELLVVAGASAEEEELCQRMQEQYIDRRVPQAVDDGDSSHVLGGVMERQQPDLSGAALLSDDQPYQPPLT